jgi:hypothetical protein
MTMRDASNARRWGVVMVASLMTGALVAGAPPAASAPLPPIRHVWIIQLENESAGSALADNGYIGKTLPKLGEVLTNYDATGHVSLDNYISEISGQAPNAETQSDCQDYVPVSPGTLVDGQAVGEGCVYPADVPTVADQLTAKGLSWKAYMGDMGNTPSRDHTTTLGDCGHPILGTADATQVATPADQYASRHDPFVYFESIIGTAECDNVVPLTRLAGDLTNAATTPDYTWITPNLCDDGHDDPCSGTNLAGTHTGGFPAIDDFLSRYVPMIMDSAAFKAGGMLVVTFDESADSDTASCCGATPGPDSPLPGISGPGGGNVATFVVSPFVKPGSTDNAPYNHYALLRTVEDIFGLSHLGEAGNVGENPFGPDVFNAATLPSVPAVAPAPGSPGPLAAGTPPAGTATTAAAELPSTGGPPATGLAVMALIAGAAAFVVARRVRSGPQA